MKPTLLLLPCLGIPGRYYRAQISKRLTELP